MKLTFTITICLLISQSISQLVITDASAAAGQYQAVPLEYIGAPKLEWDTISGLLVPSSVLPAHKEGRIVLTISPYLEFEPIIIYELQFKPSAIVVGANTPFDPVGERQYVIDGSDVSSFTVPIIEITNADYMKLLSIIEGEVKNGTFPLGVPITVTRMSNPWQEHRGNVWNILWSLTAGGFSLANIVIIALKIKELKASGMDSWGIAIFCCSLELLANLIRATESIVDPMWTRGFLPNFLQQVFSTFPFFLEQVSFLLITFYWHELISFTHVRVAVFLTRLKLPFLIIIIALGAFEILWMIMRNFITEFVVIGSIIKVVILVITAIYYIWISIRVALFMKKKSTVGDKAKQQQLILRTIILSILTILMCVVYATPLFSFFWNITGYLIVWWLFYNLQNSMSLVITLFFRPKEKTTSTSLTTQGTSSA